MISHTEAYLKYKAQSEAILDFAVIVCFAVPALKANVNVLKKGIITKLPTPDFFLKDVSTPAKLIERAKPYKSRLAAYLWMSNFSFFEAFIVDAVREMIDFHGGDVGFLSLAERHDKKFLKSIPPNLHAEKRKLQEYPKKSKLFKYQKYSRALDASGYRFPSSLLSSYGVRMLNSKVGSLKAHAIPELLQQGLHLPIDASQVSRFHEIRNMRNKIAHGETVNLTLSRVMRMHEDLHQLAVVVDSHLIEHYFIIEKYTS